MTKLWRQLDPLRVLALCLLLVPVLALSGFGVLWLWQTDNLAYWLSALVGLSAAGYGLQRLLQRRERKLLAEAVTHPDPLWPASAGAIWQDVDTLAERLVADEWPLDDGGRMLDLARRTLETVARHYHPGVSEPLLELTVPHMLLIIERASRDLRRDISGHIPFSHRLTIGDMLRVRRWHDAAGRAFDFYRMGRALVSPIDALIGEAWREVRGRGFGMVGKELHGWLLRAYVRKLGYYAIELYSGRLPLDDGALETATQASRADLRAAGEEHAFPLEPLRILVLGRANAGKSSLINALFGQLASVADVAPDTTATLIPHALEREGLTQALIFDAPGCESISLASGAMRVAALNADLIVWVSPVHRPDRQFERTWLDSLRALQAGMPERAVPPLLVAASHIDQLRPAGDWNPPYDLVDPRHPKGRNIRDAVVSIATELAVPVADVVPVCLAAERVYNVEDAFWAAILAHQDEARRVRLLRCLDARKRDENWVYLRRQLISAGRLLWRLPEQFKD